jgi:hypothetical protein
MNPIAPPFEDQLKQGYDLLLSTQGASRVELWRNHAPNLPKTVAMSVAK